MSEVNEQVIIGNGAAGLSAVKAIRQKGWAGRITVISAEKCNAYSPVLTTYYISGKVGEGELFIANEEFYRRYDVNMVLGNKATGIDASASIVHLDNGSKIGFDNLLIASGASPKRLDNVDADFSDRVLTLRTIEDAKKIKRLSEHVNEVIFLGAGLVSLQTANALYKKGMKFTFVVSSEQVLSRNIDAGCAAIVQREIESQGISILLRRNVSEIGWEGDKLVVILDSGEELRAEIVIVGKGTNPNIELTKASGINVNKGILVDESMRTNIENIFAAGDVAEGKSLVTGENNIVQTWPSACEQGRIAGLNMIGSHRVTEGTLNANITRVFGLTVAAIGLAKPLNGSCEEFKYVNVSEKIYRRILLKDDRLVGAVLLNRVEDIGLIGSLIRNKTDISPLKGRIVKTPLDPGRVIHSIINRGCD